MIDKTKLEKVGFDRLEFYIDFDKVDFSKYKYKKNEKLGTSSIDIVSYVNDKQFKYRLFNSRRNNTDILRLDVVLPRIFYEEDHNIYNVSAGKNTKEALKLVLKDIKDDNKIDIPLSSLKVTKMEINKTILLEEDTTLYYDVFCYLLDNKCTVNNQGSGLTVTKIVDKKRKRYKFYDKKEELKNSIKLEVEEELCRFEITLTGSESVFRTFNTTNILKIKQSEINKFYKKAIKDLEENLEKNIKMDSEELLNLFIRNKCLTLADLRESYQELDDKKRIIFKEVVSNAVNTYRSNYTKNSETVKKIIGSKSENKNKNYKRAKKLLKKLKK